VVFNYKIFGTERPYRVQGFELTHATNEEAG
jgi:hypothetical protein